MPKKPSGTPDIDARIKKLDDKKRALEIQRDIRKLQDEKKKLRGK